MTYGKILNPYLYNRLREVFGKVRLSKAGEGMKIRPGTSEIVESGEYYCVNCPFCAERDTPDRKQHLWINHRWGVGYGLDPMFWAALCYRNDCLNIGDNLERLKDMVRVWDLPNTLRPVEITDEDPDDVKQVDLPGSCVPLLSRIDRWVIDYFLSHGFSYDDMVRIADEETLLYCVSSDNQKLNNTIVIPFYVQGVMVGWQCKGPHLKGYYTCPDMRISRTVYGFDKAVKKDFVVIVEGVTDAWKVGAPAVAVCGGQVSTGQARLLAKYFDTAVLMLDGDAIQTRRSRSMKVLTEAGIIATEIVLPYGDDPGSLPRDFLWEKIQEAINKHVVDIKNRRDALWLPA